MPNMNQLKNFSKYYETVPMQISQRSNDPRTDDKKKK